MAICKDPSLTFLNDKGYNVILLPREGIDPLDIIGQDGNSKERLGSLSQIWTTTQAPPAAKTNVASNMNGSKTENFKISIGLKLLANMLQGMGAPSVDAAYQQAKQVQFTFSNVESVVVDPFEVGNFLAAGDLKSNNAFVEHYFVDQGTTAYVITEVLMSDSITVSAKNDSGASVSVDLPAIQALVGAKVGVTAGAGSTSDVTYKGPAKLTFGFKIFGIQHQNGKWNIFGVKPSGDHAFSLDMGALSHPPEPIVFSPGSMTIIGNGNKTAGN